MFRHHINIITARRPTSIGVLANVGFVLKKLKCVYRHICNIKPVFHGACFEADSALILYAPYPRLYVYIGIFAI